MVNGRNLCAIPVDVWRTQLAWVPQSPYLFATSIADNIRLADPDAPLDAVIRAAQQAQAHSFITQFPQGYDTLIGERGARLSGGQAQRIALARAFLKDAPFLLLDEATANLDPVTEAQVVEAMHALMRDRTVLVIAHRLQTVQNADYIVVLDGGRAVEMGTHAELTQRQGAYARLLAEQGASS
jgi:ATP-binding cassette subfamily C protein CydD